MSDMTKVITYGTYDLLHYGHIRLLKRAKELGDYLIVGVTADDFDKTRGKINVQQSLMERIEAVRATGLADKIIVEEYEGQKIDDIRRYGVDIFTVGSDWKGKFDYLNEFCKVIYLDRTDGISSSELRAEQQSLRLGIVGTSPVVEKYITESKYVNGVEAINAQYPQYGLGDDKDSLQNGYSYLLKQVDAVYIGSSPKHHYWQICQALKCGKHVLCEAPIALTEKQSLELFKVAQDNNCVLMDAIKTAYSMAYSRLLLLLKEGIIGDIYSVDATCTSLRNLSNNSWDSICEWGPTALLPVFDILGTTYKAKQIVSHMDDQKKDLFTRVTFVYEHAVASVKVGTGVKSEGELIISGTKGYVYVPAPWWKMEYFETRYEDSSKNRRYFYQLDGEGIRYELVSFLQTIRKGKKESYIRKNVSSEICGIIEDFYKGTDFIKI